MTTARILSGSPPAAALRRQTAAAAALLRDRGIGLTLATLLVGDEAAASVYRAQIERALQGVGIGHLPVTLPAATDEVRLVRVIEALNLDQGVTGVLVMLPLPNHLPTSLIQEHLSPLKDVDGITPENAGRLHLGLPALRPSTPQGGIELLDYYGIQLSGRLAVVVGRSSVVGRPLAMLLSLRDATVTLCHRRTPDLAALTRQADLVASAAGQAGLIRGEMVKSGAVVLDFGVDVVDGKVLGDVDVATVAAVAAAYTPTPGGTGPVTAQVLARNTVAAAFAALGGGYEELGRQTNPRSPRRLAPEG
jgi:methylenetetrahydrofolate dehydrogenase (NADP+)/methenyltetrahydrofolate cyclohydrolase